MRYREGAAADELGAGMSFRGAGRVGFNRTTGARRRALWVGTRPVEALAPGVRGPLFGRGNVA